MRSDPRAFITLDTGAATVAAALIGRAGGRWRLIGSLALPAGVDPEALVGLLLHRARQADPALAVACGFDDVQPNGLPRVEVASHPPRRLAVVSGAERSIGPLVAAASRSGWLTSSASVERADPLQMSTLLMDPSIDAILAGAGDPAAADERRSLAELGAVVAAAAIRRPVTSVVLAGGMAGQMHAFTDGASRPGRIIGAPAARSGPDGAGLREVLVDLALPENDARRVLGTVVMDLVALLDRRIDVVEIGFDGGTRAGAWQDPATGEPALDLAIVPAAGLAPQDPDDHVVDRVTTWSTWTTDRHRVRDRMRELRIAPWSEATGEGVAVRLAAARAALGLLAHWTPTWNERQAADLVVATGGVWAVASAPSIALALSDVLRRSGAHQVALDHARMLAPLGAIPDDRERRAVIRDLVDDLLVPIGTVIMPAGLRHARAVGGLQVHGLDGHASRGQQELRSGAVQLVALPPGAATTAELRFNDPVRLGGRGRHFALEVTGGLGGVLVDLRDVPLRLPDRADLRNEMLDTWQAAVHDWTRP